jgi:hypothetical protein
LQKAVNGVPPLVFLQETLALKPLKLSLKALVLYPSVAVGAPRRHGVDDEPGHRLRMSE